MTRATWDDAGQRLFFAGVDHGMLYTGDKIPLAVPWSGLASITEASAGSDPSPYYLDGRKILNLATGENFAGTIEAFSSPDEFAPCAGRSRLSTGLFASDQPRQTFGFSYRTLVGNDTVSTAFGYKVHIVFNATAQVANFTHATIAGDPTPKTNSWAFTTYPISVLGYKPTAHFIFDTRVVDPHIMANLEDVLYGSDTDDPRLPSIDELLMFLANLPPAKWFDLSGGADFPGDSVNGDMGVDFDTGSLYANTVENNTAFWWDLTGLTDFPVEEGAISGDWGIDTIDWRRLADDLGGLVRVTWADAHLYSQGVSNGVLYPQNSPGVSWNGLISVSETGDTAPTARYFDGQKYMDDFALGTYAGTISAFTYPDEFEPCIGLDTRGHGPASPVFRIYVPGHKGDSYCLQCDCISFE